MIQNYLILYNYFNVLQTFILFVLFMSCVCHAFACVHCCLVVTKRERADLLALVCDVYCDFVTFPFGILGQVWYLIVSIPDPCCLSYFQKVKGYEEHFANSTLIHNNIIRVCILV